MEQFGKKAITFVTRLSQLTFFINLQFIFPKFILRLSKDLPKVRMAPILKAISVSY